MTDYERFIVTVSGRGHEYVTEKTITDILYDAYAPNTLEFFVIDFGAKGGTDE